ncbi:hypothetical protein [Streptomyces sp. NPDC059278]|uniref:hypothetical protein n=1 Tax=Streptomyces sp. NPDC059278 TaxID=3346801 RepID=UPI00367B49B5
MSAARAGAGGARALGAELLSARLIVTETAGREEVDILWEAICRPHVLTGHGLVLSPLKDLVGTKVRAPADHGLARDLIDVWAAANRWSSVELEELSSSGAATPVISPPLTAPKPRSPPAVRHLPNHLGPVGEGSHHRQDR